MSAVAQFLLLAAIEVAGLYAIWFVVRARVRRYLDLENLLDGVREEARALVLELNETADRNVSLVEDRMAALREILAETDRRIVVSRRELSSRENEREVYAKLNKRRPIIPGSVGSLPIIEPASEGKAPEAANVSAPDAPIRLALEPAEAVLSGQRQAPEISVPGNAILPGMTRREEALDLYRRGFSADLIAARTGATVAEIELLVEMEERRSAGKGSEP